MMMIKLTIFKMEGNGIISIRTVLSINQVWLYKPVFSDKKALEKTADRALYGPKS